MDNEDPNLIPPLRKGGSRGDPDNKERNISPKFRSPGCATPLAREL